MIAKISIKYWLKNKRKIFLVAVCLIVLMIGIELALYLAREERMIFFQEGGYGLFDNIIYQQDKDKLDNLKDMDEVFQYGGHYELGYISDENSYCIQKVAAFFDKQSEEMYQKPCIYGHHPISDDEISMDINAALRYGITDKQIGKKVKLKLYDLDVKEIMSKEYVISGFFEGSFNKKREGFKTVIRPNRYINPVVFVNVSQNSIFNSDKVTSYINTNKFVSLSDIKEFLSKKNFEIDSFNDDDYFCENSRRMEKYSYILSDNNNDLDNNNIVDLIEKYNTVIDGNNCDDEKSEDVSPKLDQEQLDKFIELNIQKESSLSKVFIGGAIWISIILLIWILYVVEKKILIERENSIKILRNYGVSRNKIVSILFAEMFVIISFFSTLGIVLGDKLYDVIFYYRKKDSNIFLMNAKCADKYIKSVTKDPHMCPIYMGIVLFIISCFIFIFLLRKKEIIYVINSFIKKHRIKYEIDESKEDDIEKNDLAISKKGKNRKKTIIMEKLGVGFLLGRKFRASSVIITTIVFLGMFSLSFFRIYADYFVEYNYCIDTSDAQIYQYQADKEETLLSSIYIENKHEEGINRNTFNDCIEKNNIKDYFAIIENKSFKMSVENNVYKKMPKCLRELECTMLSKKRSECKQLEPLYVEKTKKELEAQGYSENEKVINIPLIGVSQKELSDIEKYVIDGKINIDKVKSGDEMIVFLNKEYYSEVRDYFKVGKNMNFSDCILDENLEQVRLNDISYHDYNSFDNDLGLEKVYDEFCEYYDDFSGTNCFEQISGYKWGQKKDVNTRIGAIVVFDNENISKYMTRNDGSSIVNIACCEDTFSSIGLPDVNYTRVGINIDDNINGLDFVKNWDDMLDKSDGIIDGCLQVSDTLISLNLKSIYKYIFDILNFIICFLSIVGILLISYNKVVVNKKSIMMVKTMGIEKKQLFGIMMIKNIVIIAFATGFTLLVTTTINYIVQNESTGGNVYGNVPRVFHNLPNDVDFLQSSFWHKFWIAFIIYSCVSLIAMMMNYFIIFKKECFIKSSNLRGR